jgi:RNA polymerase sigma factor (sigma-70 family)
MSTLETTMGGSRECFPETVWASVLSPGHGAASQRDQAMNRLFSLYWRPVYKFIRTAGGRSIEDAKDLTQEFFSYLLEGDVITKFEGEKGRFRTFLKGVLRNFLSETHRNASRLKRGGGRLVVQLDPDAIERGGFPAEREHYKPEQIFDRQWAAEVLAQSLSELRVQLVAEGKPEYLKVYEAYYGLSGLIDGRPTYSRIAGLLGLTEQNVKNYLEVARARFEEIVRSKLMQGVTSPEELSEEIDALLSP